MKKFLSFACAGLLAIGLAACSNDTHAASNTNDLIANNAKANPAANGRLYAFAEAPEIVQVSPAQFNIVHLDGTVASIADVDGSKFAALQKWSGFSLSWLVAHQGSQTVLVNIGQSVESSCAGSYLSVAFPPSSGLHGAQSFDDANCAAYAALFAAAN